MATNTFKRITKASLSSSSGSPTSVYTVPTSKTTILIGCLITNKTTTAATVNVKIDTAITAQDDVMLTNAMSIPANSSVELSMGKIVLNHDGSNGDTLKVWGSAASTFDITLSILEDVN